MTRIACLFALVLLLPAAAQAQEIAPAPACDADAAAPAIWSGWSQTEALSASVTDSNTSALKAGQAYALSLSPAAQVTLASGRPGKAGTFAGLLGFNVTQAGVYTIALDQPAWVDIVASGASLHPSGHAQAVACTSIHKTVDFQLAPGHYTVQISNAPQAALRLEVQPK
jgi:hypothetical protein